MKNFILKGLQYFLMFQVSILVAMIISLLFVTPIRFFVESKVVESGIMAVVGFVLEMVFIIFCFFKEKVEFKNISLIKFVSPCVFAVFLHSIISYINGFYMYIAGISVSESGIIWQNYYSEYEYVITDMREVELFRLIIPFVIISIFRIGAVFLGYYFGKQKNDKFKQELIKE